MVSFLVNFTAPVLFYIAFYGFGAKVAIAIAIISTTIQLLFHWIYSIRMSPFFIAASGFTVGFGSIDLMVQNPRFYRFEPFAQNFAIATLFLLSFLRRFPLLAHLTGALPQIIRPHLSETTTSYLRNLTLVWSIYLYLKAGLFLYLAFRLDLGKLILWRSLIGGVTLVLMVLGELGYRKYWRQK